MNACHLRVVLMLISHAPTPKALTNAHVIMDLFWSTSTRHAALVCNKICMCPCQNNMSLSRCNIPTQITKAKQSFSKDSQQIITHTIR